MTGIQLIFKERKRQVEEEGWDHKHDEKENPIKSRLFVAATCYHRAADERALMKREWPWQAKWWKPKDRLRNLVRAGALYLAAAEQLRYWADMAHQCAMGVGGEIDTLQDQALHG